MNPKEGPGGGRRIAWQNVLTVVSAAILIGAEVFGAAFAGGWALYNVLLAPFYELFGLERYGIEITQAALCLCGAFVMYVFIRNARRVEPFTVRA
jgi:hypothetical protein